MAESQLILKELTASAGDIAFSKGQEVELKGLSGKHRVFEVGWHQPARTNPPPSRPSVGI